MKNKELIKHLKQKVLALLGVKEYKIWKPCLKQTYYSVYYENYEALQNPLVPCMDTVIYLKTEAEAEFEANLNKLNLKARLFSRRNGWIPNWKDTEEAKWCIVYYHNIDEDFDIIYNTNIQVFNAIYFQTEYDAQRFYDENKQDIQKYWLCNL